MAHGPLSAGYELFLCAVLGSGAQEMLESNTLAGAWSLKPRSHVGGLPAIQPMVMGSFKEVNMWETLFSKMTRNQLIDIDQNDRILKNDFKNLASKVIQRLYLYVCLPYVVVGKARAFSSVLVVILCSLRWSRNFRLFRVARVQSDLLLA